MNGVRVAVVSLVLFAGVHAAHAALFDDEEARKRIVITNDRIDKLQKDLDARLGAVEDQSRGQGLDLFNQLEGIKADLARIRGQIEVLTYELAEAQKRQRDLYVDLDSRMRKLEAVPAPAGAGPTGGSILPVRSCRPMRQPVARPWWVRCRRPPPPHQLPRPPAGRRRSP